MKTEIKDLSETRKQLAVEIPSAAVDKAIDRWSRRYSRSAKLPGFRPGKVPQKLVRTRFLEQILRDVANDLIPQAVNDALSEHGVRPVGKPAIRDVSVKEGQPLTFTAAFEMVPPVDPGNYDGFTLRRRPIDIGEDAINEALEQVRQGAAHTQPVEGRPTGPGDTVTLDLERRTIRQPATKTTPKSPGHHENVTVEIGNAANPPGFDQHVLGLTLGTRHEFTLTYPDGYEIKELAGAEVAYSIVVKGIHERVVPALDDEFARGVGEYGTLTELRERVSSDLTRQAERDADLEMRDDLLKQLASRVAVEVPEALVSADIDRRVGQLARHLIGQRIDPRRANVDWDAFRDEQRSAATDAVRGTLVLDEIARREELEVTEQDLEREIVRQAEHSGRTSSAVRALVEKEGGIGVLTTGLRREKAIDFLLARATIVAV